MQVSKYLYSTIQNNIEKINDEMRMIYITQIKPKQKIRLDPLDPQNINVDLNVVQKWSQNNRQLYQLLLSNGMAEFICNRQFLNQFYTHLQFVYAGIAEIDGYSMKLTNLKVLNLFHNKIVVLQNIPPSCLELYVDFNEIEACKIKKCTNLELLSISHNKIDNTICEDILRQMPQLRCLNIAYNRIDDIRKFVKMIKQCKKMKILITRDNPISMLNIYTQYINEEIGLQYFDNQKYVKEVIKEQKVEKQVKEQEKKEEKKQNKKQSKKQTKKQTKKNTKVQQQSPESARKKAQVKVIELPKIKTEQNFQKIKLKISINEFQNFAGIIYESQLFPQQNLNIQQIQSCFWIQINVMNKKYTTNNNKIYMDSFIPDNNINRLNFNYQIQQQFQVNYSNLLTFIQGLTIYIYKQQPCVVNDQQTGQQKVVLNQQKKIKIKVQCLGGIFINFNTLLCNKKKIIQKNYNIFDKDIISCPMFKKPYQNQNQLITKNKVQFEAVLLAREQQKKKKQAQQQQSPKQKKKGGKQTKKAPVKKQTKKDSKQVIGQKKIIGKCTFANDLQQYRYLGENKMFKCLGERLGVRVVIE